MGQLRFIEKAAVRRFFWLLLIPMARYIARTTAWKQGRRKVLDWGCGGGGLACALAKQGAERVVAVDLSTNATKAAQVALEPYPNALARGPRFSLLGPPGQIGYSSQFDIVVSFCGALSDGSTFASRIPTVQAVKQAARACSVGGSVILSQQFKFRHYSHMISVALACVIGRTVKARWLWDNPGWWQYCFWLLLTFPLYGFSLSWETAFIMKNVARSCMLRQWRASSIVFGCLMSLIFAFFRWSESVLAEHLKKQLAAAGLQDIKYSRHFVFPATSTVAGRNASLGAKRMSLLMNVMLFPAMPVLIVEGVKKQS